MDNTIYLPYIMDGQVTFIEVHWQAQSSKLIAKSGIWRSESLYGIEDKLKFLTLHSQKGNRTPESLREIRNRKS